MPMSINHSDGTSSAPKRSWSHADVIAMLEHAALFFQASVSGLKNEALDEEVADGATVRDIVIHLAAWEDEFLREATAARSSNARFDYRIAASPCASGWARTSAWDEEQRQTRRESPTGAIFLELEQTHQRLMNFARSLSPRKLGHRAEWPWGGESTVAELLVVAAAHKREHAETIRTWRTGGG